MLLQLETGLDMAGKVLEHSSQQGFLVEMLVFLVIFFASLFIFAFWLYTQKQNTIIEILQKQSDAQKLIESLAENKLKASEQQGSSYEIKMMMQEIQSAMKNLKN